MTNAAEQTSPGGNKVCAVLVAYFPDVEFSTRLRVVLPQVGALVVIDNTPEGSASWITLLPDDERARISVIENRSNLGVAAALNQGLNHANQTGCRWLLTLDQDTQCFPDIVDTLRSIAVSSHPKPAIVGGNYFDAKRDRHDVPVGDGSKCLDRKTVITSGCLVDTAFALAIGGFREDYFIDQLDHEFCLRARSKGGRVVVSRKPVMEHSVGGATGPRVPILGTMLPDHPPLRKYYITRNTIVTIADFWSQEPGWCLRRSARLLIGLFGMATIEDHRLAKVLAFILGAKDGIQRRMGPCDRIRLTQRG